MRASPRIGYNPDTKRNICDYLTQFRMSPSTRTASTKYTGRQAGSRRTLCTAPCHAPSRRAAQPPAAGSSSTSSEHRPPSTTGLSCMLCGSGRSVRSEPSQEEEEEYRQGTAVQFLDRLGPALYCRAARLCVQPAGGQCGWCDDGRRPRAVPRPVSPP